MSRRKGFDARIRSANPTCVYVYNPKCLYVTCLNACWIIIQAAFPHFYLI